MASASRRSQSGSRGITGTGQVESLEIVCDGEPWFAPWNLIYDEQPDAAAFRGAGGSRRLGRSGECDTTFAAENPSIRCGACPCPENQAFWW